MGTLKNGSKCKRLLQEFSHPRISKRTVRLAQGEYLQIVDFAKDNGLHTFKNPNIDKVWRGKKVLKPATPNTKETVKENPTVNPTKKAK